MVSTSSNTRWTLVLGAYMLLCLVAVTSAAPARADQIMADLDQIVPEEVLAEPTDTSTDDDIPDWFKKGVAAIRVEDSASVFTTKAFWESIKAWDKAVTDLKKENLKFFEGNEEKNKWTLAAFLGNVAQETGGLKFPSELNHDTDEPCTIAKGNCKAKYGKYFGRGALQITCWNGEFCPNYKLTGEYFGVKDIKNNPDQVATNSTLAWGSAIAYWTTNEGYGSLGPAAKYPGDKDFGGTYATINGGQECKPPTGANDEGVKDPRVANRIAKFKAACKAEGSDCDDFKTACPVVKLGICKNKKTWDCKNDADCGDKVNGPCCFDCTKPENDSHDE